jgi:predicted phosphodiesterase
VPYLILSDVHSNREALEAVVQDAQGLYDGILCLGDIVGYGADPNFTADWMRAHSAISIRGNHDKLCVGLDVPEVYNAAARASALWTRQVLTPANAAYLFELPRGPLRVGAFDLVHGSPADEDEYVVHAGDAAMVREYLDAPVTFFGHTHVQGGFLFARRGIKRITPEVGVVELEPEHRYLLNPGSVGQPRDMNPKAAYAIYTPEKRTLEFRRVKYDIPAAAQKILDAGLPNVLALRLYEGA